MVKIRQQKLLLLQVVQSSKRKDKFLKYYFNNLILLKNLKYQLFKMSDSNFIVKSFLIFWEKASFREGVKVTSWTALLSR